MDAARPSGHCLNQLHITTQESWWKRYIRVLRKPSNGMSIRPRDAVSFPSIDCVVFQRPASRFGQTSSKPIHVAERDDQVCVRLNHEQIVGISVRLVNADISDDGNLLPMQTAQMADDKRTPYNIACGSRLRKTREALDFPKLRRFAENTGIAESNLTKWENGYALVPPHYTQRLKEVFGVTHDWIYGGDASSLRHDLAIKLLKPGNDSS